MLHFTLLMQQLPNIDPKKTDPDYRLVFIFYFGKRVEDGHGPEPGCLRPSNIRWVGVCISFAIAPQDEIAVKVSRDQLATLRAKVLVSNKLETFFCWFIYGWDVHFPISTVGISMLFSFVALTEVMGWLGVANMTLSLLPLRTSMANPISEMLFRAALLSLGIQHR